MLRKTTAFTVAVLLGPAGVLAQTRIDLGRQGRNVDFRQESSTKPSKSGETLPELCEPAEVFVKTNAPEGENLYICVEPNRWAAQTVRIVGAGGVHSICGGGTCTLQADTAYLQWRKNGQDGVDLLVATNLGSATAYSGCPTTNTPAGKIIESYTAGMRLYMLPDVSGGGGATTLDICNLGSKPLKRGDGSSDPGANDLLAGRLYRIWYDGAVFRLPDVSWGAISGSLADQADLQTVFNGKQSVSAKGQANGYASLGSDGKVPLSQLPGGQGSQMTVQVDGETIGAAPAINLLSAPGFTWTGESSPESVSVRPGIAESYWAKVQTVQSGSPWIVTTAGGPSAFTGTMEPPLTEENLRPGTRLVWVVNASCAAGPVSLAIDGVGAKPVKKVTPTGLSDPAAADCPAGAPVSLLYDGAAFRMETAAAPSAGGVIPNAHYRTVPIGTSMSSVAAVSSAGQMRYARQTVGYGIAVRAVAVRIGAGVPDAAGRIGVYALDGTKLIDSGDLSFTASNTTVSASVSHTLPAGEYYFVWTATDPGVTLSGVTSSVANEVVTAHSPDTYYMGNAVSRWSGPGEPLPEILSISSDAPAAIPLIVLMP